MLADPILLPVQPDGRPTVLFIINSLAGGGAERVMLELATASAEHAADYNVVLVLLDDEKREYAPPDWLSICQLHTRGSLPASILQLYRLARKLKPVATLSFLTRANTASVVVARLCGHRAIISERVNTSHHFSGGLSSHVSRAVVRLSYPFADSLIAVSQGIADDLRANFSVPAGKLAVIGNPVNTQRIRQAAAQSPAMDLPEKYIVAISRLTGNKNPMLVVEALAQADTDLPLVLLGQGPERDAILDRARALGIADRVIMPGFLANPYPILQQAACYVSGSNAEGFPNGLVEALALGVPAISTNCPSGPSEVLDARARDDVSGIHKGRWGLIVPQNDPASMAQAMTMILDPVHSQQYARVGPERAQMFSVAAATTQYWDVIRSTLATEYAQPVSRAA